MSNLAVTATWVTKRPSGGNPLLDATMGRVAIDLAGKQITKHRTDGGDIEDRVEAPLIHLAEWIAVNWWALLFEPKKKDEAEEDPGFRFRHWLGSAHNGFALPDVWILPAGDAIEFVAKRSYLRFAGVHFLEEAETLVPLDRVRAALAKFVDDVVARLNRTAVTGMTFPEIWDLVKQTKPEAEVFCKLIGALGLSPYDDHAAIENLLEELQETLDEDLVLKLCQASDAKNLPLTSKIVRAAWDGLGSVPPVDLSGVADVVLPQDRLTTPAWRRGVQAVNRIRERWGIAPEDPGVGWRFFERLRFDPNASFVPTSGAERAPNVSGAVDREEMQIRVAVVDEREAQRRFSAARGAFLGWSSPPVAHTLVTAAKTREQQSSRAFAAELLAPFAYIRRRARGEILLSYDMDELAEELKVSPIVIHHQATNNGLVVTSY